MGDILAALGLGDTGVVSALIGGWDRIISAVRPDIVAAEYAPALMLAARGRVPLLAFGTGFTLPPAGLSIFPSLTTRPAIIDETALLAALNRELAVVERAPIPTLPALFAADLRLIQVFTELDPYRAWRTDEIVSAPHMRGLPPLSDGTGDEIFIYLSGQEAWPAGFWDGVIDSKLPVRVHDPRLDASAADILERQGITVERDLVPLDRIVERSRLIVNHGGLGLTAAALCAGVPLGSVAFDLEKRLIAASLAAIGLGSSTEYRTLDRAGTAAFLRAAYTDRVMRHASLAAAPGFRARATQSPGEDVADAVDRLIERMPGAGR